MQKLRSKWNDISSKQYRFKNPQRRAAAKIMELALSAREKAEVQCSSFSSTERKSGYRPLEHLPRNQKNYQEMKSLSQFDL